MGRLSFNQNAPLTAESRGGRDHLAPPPSYMLIPNRAYRFLQDRESMKTRFFSGLGGDFLADDGCVTQGAGPIQDRTQEHMGYTDKSIAAARKALLRAIKAVQAGEEAPGVARDPAHNNFGVVGATKDIVPASFGWSQYWEHEAAATEVLVGVR